MKRFQDWPTRMHDWLEAHALDTFTYGQWDCCLAAGAHIDNICGTAIFSGHVGKYSADTHTAYLAGLGFATLDELVTSFLGAQLIHERKAQRGDIVCFDTDFGRGLGIIDLSGLRIVAIHPDGNGFIRIPVRKVAALSAWRV